MTQIKALLSLVHSKSKKGSEGKKEAVTKSGRQKLPGMVKGLCLSCGREIQATDEPPPKRRICSECLGKHLAVDNGKAAWL